MIKSLESIEGLLHPNLITLLDLNNDECLNDLDTYMVFDLLDVVTSY